MQEEILEQLKRIAKALEKGNQIAEKSNQITSDWIELQTQWRTDARAIDLDWIAWNKQQKQNDIERQDRQDRLTLEESLKSQQEFQNAILAQHEASLLAQEKLSTYEVQKRNLKYGPLDRIDSLPARTLDEAYADTPPDADEIKPLKALSPLAVPRNIKRNGEPADQ